MPVKGLDALLTAGTDAVAYPARGAVRMARQERVNARQHPVKAGCPTASRPLTGAVIENLVAALVGTALVAYLVYALVRPDRF